jgi:hypothetical protein
VQGQCVLSLKSSPNKSFPSFIFLFFQNKSAMGAMFYCGLVPGRQAAWRKSNFLPNQANKKHRA